MHATFADLSLTNVLPLEERQDYIGSESSRVPPGSKSFCEFVPDTSANSPLFVSLLPALLRDAQRRSQSPSRLTPITHVSKM